MRSSFAAVAAVLAVASAHGSLGIGDSAPPLKAQGFVKGGQVNLKHGVHIVEFWATWCGPCRVSIPHLTELAKEYRGKVDFTGVSVMERGDNTVGQVKHFVKQMGSKMVYNVAYDDKNSYMSTHWLESAGIDAIPTAFLVKDGKILWIGSPFESMPTRIDQALNGTLNLASAKKEYFEALDEQFMHVKVESEMGGLLQPIDAALKKSDGNSIIATMDTFQKQYPTTKWQSASMKARLLLQIGDPRGYTLVNELSTGHYSDNPSVLSQLAWEIVVPGSPANTQQLQTGLSLAKKAVDLTKGTDGDYLDTYATALYRVGDKSKALAAESKAVVLLKRDGNPQLIEAAQKRLTVFKQG